MTKLDLLLARISKLSVEQQEAVVEEIGFIVEGVEEGGSVLTDDQWAQVEAALANKDEPTSTHEELFARLEAEDR
jgi:hypothetical protein